MTTDIHNDIHVTYIHSKKLISNKQNPRKIDSEQFDKLCANMQNDPEPIECMARPIRNNTAIGESVYDPFLGSGTTLMASEQLKRFCYGIELSPAYCDIIVKRWSNWMKKNNKPFTIKRNGEEFSLERNAI